MKWLQKETCGTKTHEIYHDSTNPNIVSLCSNFFQLPHLHPVYALFPILFKLFTSRLLLFNLNTGMKPSLQLIPMWTPLWSTTLTHFHQHYVPLPSKSEQKMKLLDKFFCYPNYCYKCLPELMNNYSNAIKNLDQCSIDGNSKDLFLVFYLTYLLRKGPLSYIRPLLDILFFIIYDFGELQCYGLVFLACYNT